MPNTNDFVTTSWNSVRQAITRRPGRAVATGFALLAAVLVMLVYSVPAQAATGIPGNQDRGHLNSEEIQNLRVEAPTGTAGTLPLKSFRPAANQKPHGYEINYGPSSQTARTVKRIGINGVNPGAPQVNVPTDLLLLSLVVPEDGNSVRLTFNKPLGSLSDPDFEAFTVTAGVVEHALQGGYTYLDERRTMVLPVSPAIRQNRQVRVRYTRPGRSALQDADERPLKDTDGNDVNEFNLKATNNSTFDASDSGVGPAPVGAQVWESGTQITVYYDENIKDTFLTGCGGDCGVGDRFTVTVDGARVRPASNARAGAANQGRDHHLILFVYEDIEAGQTVKLSYADPNPGSNDGITRRGNRFVGTYVVEDTGGRDGESFTNIPVTNSSKVPAKARSTAPPEPLTAAFQNLPGNHDETAFTFTFAFSEEFPVDADTVSAALAVTGGSITTVVQTDPPNNRNWQITVQPSAPTTAVTLSLVPKESCTDEGAICTEDDRGIANANIAFIPGVPPPVMTGVAITNGPGANDAWDTDETVQAQVQFSAQISVSGPPNVGPILTILLDGVRRDAAYTGGDGTDTLTFSYTVTAADDGAGTARVAPNGLSLNGTTLADSFGQEAQLRFATAPYITRVERVPESSGDAAWTTGETIEARLTFNEAVTVADGTPRIGVSIDGNAGTLDYASGTGSATLVFSRTVTSDEGSLTSISVTADSLALNGATIVSEASELAAELSHPGATTLAVAFSRSSEQDPDDNAADALTAEFLDRPVSHDGTAFTFTLAFSEEFPVTAATVQSALEVTGGAITNVVQTSPPNNQNWQITVQPSAPDTAVILFLVPKENCTDEGAICTEDDRGIAGAIGALIDAVPPLTAEFLGLPESHGGETFTFELRFSEEVTIGYRDLREATFVVSNGQVQKAKRIEQGQTQRWNITVKPNESEDVEILLPVAASCTSGVICTADQRPLSEPVLATVPHTAETPAQEETEEQQEVQNSPATGQPSISGTAQVGETLNAGTSGITDTDGITNAVFTYHWIRVDGTNETDMTGATSSSYTLVEADQAKTVKVQVSFTDAADNDEMLTSPATGTVAAANSPATGQPSVSGTAQVAETLTAGTSGIADTDGTANATFTYQWIRVDGANDTDISGATASSYTLADADEGKTIKVRVSFTDDASNAETVTSTATATVEPEPQAENSPATGQPTIGGTAQVSETLTAGTTAIADSDGTVNAAFTYQWVRLDGLSESNISGATGTSYTLTSADEGKTIRVRVSFTDDAGNAETMTSAASATVEPEPVEPPAAPQNLTAASNNDGTITLTWDAPDDGSVTEYQILRRRPQEGENTLEIYVSNTGSTATEYTDADAPAGTRYVYRVKAINEAGAGGRSNYARVDH